jgi:hypothetical protein
MKRKTEEVEASEPRNDKSNSNVAKKIKIKASELASMDPQVQRIIKARVLVKKRDAAREEGNFEKADEIRSKLVALGVETIDQKGGRSVSSTFKAHILSLTIHVNTGMEIHGWILKEASSWISRKRTISWHQS